MSNNKQVTWELSANGVAVVTFNTPGKLNVLSSALCAELDSVLDEITEAVSNGQVKGVVFISAKPDNFFAGANLDEIFELQRGPVSAAYEAAEAGKALFNKIAGLKTITARDELGKYVDIKPVRTVAAIAGTCLGGGLELALACTHRVGVGGKKPKLSIKEQKTADKTVRQPAALRFPEVALGFLPGWAGTVRAVKLLGVEAASELVLQAMKTCEADKAWKIGLLDELTAPNSLLDAAVEVALGREPKRAKQSFMAGLKRWFLNKTGYGRSTFAKIAKAGIWKEGRDNYPAPPEALKVMLAALTMPENVAMELESKAFARLAVTPESRAQVGVFFATQESKKSPDGAKPEIEITRVAVMGAGVMGAGIAQAALYSGYEVVLYDKFQEGLDKGLKTINELFDGLVEKHKLTREEADTMLSRLTPTTKYGPMAGCQLVVEAIVEILKVKQEALAELDKVMVDADGKPLDYLFASNTSSKKIGLIGQNARKPENVGGMHFFNPVHKMNLVEVVASDKTSPATIAAFKQFVGSLGKTGVMTADTTGFAVNRILGPYLIEAIKLAEQGVPVADIEEAMKAFGMRMGPLALLDEVGLDIIGKVVESLHEAYGDRMSAPAILRTLADKKLLGKKGGVGIYLYDKPEGERKGFNPEFVAALGQPAPEPAGKKSKKKKGPSGKSLGWIQDRLALAMVNEAILCFQEGVVTDPGQLDVCMVLGTGFAPFRGGPLRMADDMGTRAAAQKLAWLAQVAGANYVPAALLVSKATTGARFYAD